MCFVHEREMTITHKEFLRILPKALSGREFQKRANKIVVLIENKTIEIELGEEAVRHIGILTLPTTKVRIEFRGFSEIDRLQFLRRFQLAYQKGGG